MFTGGSFQNFTVFALGVTPYITASIIIQLFTIAFPYFEELSKEGSTGRKKMAAITRYTGVGLALLQATGITLGLVKQSVIDKSVLNYIMIITLLTAGMSFLMWLGEQINEYGIGNGMSLIIFAGIVMRLPIDVQNLIIKVKEGSYITVAVFLIVMLLVIIGVIMVNEGVRKVPVQYAQRVVGRKTYRGQSTFIPIKVNTAGVIPIIFALSILQLPATITYFAPNSGFASFVSKYLQSTGYIYMAMEFVLIFAFTYFYTGIVFKPDEIADNLRENGGSIPGIRIGKKTEEYLARVSKNLCLFSAAFLALLALVPTLVSKFGGLSMTFGGTSVLIMVGVALETMQQVKAQNEVRQYHGFLR